MMLISFFTFLLGFLALPINADAHEFHISKCQIEYSAPDQALQITMHIFIDDLEEALRQKGTDKLFIATKKEHKKAEEYLYAYLQESFELSINNQKTAYTFIGKEPSEDLQAIWCYLEIPNLENIDALSISNTLLMEVYNDQKNIISINGPNNIQGYFLFQQGNSSEDMEF